MAKKRRKGGPSAKDRKVLAGHRQVGKRFVPAMLEIGEFRETSWIDYGIPELLWIACLNDHFGLRRGAELAVALAEATVACAKRDPIVLFAGSTAFGDLSPDEKACTVARLGVTGELSELREALRPLIALYPACPLAFLFLNSAPLSSEPTVDLEHMRRIVSDLFDRHGKHATLAASGAVYIAFVTDILKVREGLALANFSAVAQYPDTEESQRVGSSARGTMMMFLGMLRERFGGEWPRYFWNRGLELQPCSVPSGQ